MSSLVDTCSPEAVLLELSSDGGAEDSERPERAGRRGAGRGRRAGPLLALRRSGAAAGSWQLNDRSDPAPTHFACCTQAACCTAVANQSLRVAPASTQDHSLVVLVSTRSKYRSLNLAEALRALSSQVPRGCDSSLVLRAGWGGERWERAGVGGRPWRHLAACRHMISAALRCEPAACSRATQPAPSGQPAL